MGQNKKIAPRLSVTMPVYNAAQFLDESISSILRQSFSDFEFVILDDASTDGTQEILRAWASRDSRIRLFRSERNLGLSGSSNFVVQKATTPIVARMDADDVSHVDRLRRQLEVLETRPDVVAVGTLCHGIDAAGRVTRPRDRWRLVRRSRYIPFPHGSVMFRREAFEHVSGYDEQLLVGEDQEFFYKMTAVGRVVTLPDVLYIFRYHLSNATVLSKGDGVRSIAGTVHNNGHDLAAMYLLGAMRLWAGQPPQLLPELLTRTSLHWNLKSLLALSSASLGSISPGALRFLLRSFIRSRDAMAGLVIKDGRPYEWRFK
ncbi:MAG TPA: glycosyltransferase family 2 protein [Pyrinomonadaceae bacterium]|nr:glycosyltransferase family 2 protein [Pyrinomonadaceae bacterium]